MSEIDPSQQIKVWDPFVRFFHWSLVVLFVLSYLTGDEWDEIHAYSGYAILSLISLRIIWGLIGTKYARFSDFIYSPTNTMTYAKSILSGKTKTYLGHNPLGGWMVVALLVSISATGITGLIIYGNEGHGPLAKNSDAAQIFTQIEMPQMSVALADDDDEREEHGSDDDANEWLEDIHEFLANFTVFLILLHIAGVIFSSLHEKQSLPKAMLTGYKRKPENE